MSTQTIQKTMAVEIPVDVLGQLKWLSERLDKTPEQALRQAISTEAYIQEEIDKRGYVRLVRKSPLKKAVEKLAEEVLSRA